MKAILFDLEGTLVETLYQWNPRAGNQFFNKIKKKLISLGVPGNILHGEIRSPQLRNRAFTWVENNMNQSESIFFYDELNAFMKPFEMNSAIQAKLYPDTLETLSKLNSRVIKIGIATNTSSEAANYILENTGLKSYFEVIVTRNDVPRLKPDPAMIHKAIDMLGIVAEWLVGDTIVDVDAATNAGLKSIIIRRNGICPSFSHDFFVNSLKSITSIILND